jgi:hypothetical protein
MSTNEQMLREALELALKDDKFMGDNSKVNKAIAALTPKSTLTAVLKRLKGNARRDFLEKKDENISGYTDLTRDVKIREYVYDKFKSHLEDPKTSAEATKLFNAAYPPVGMQEEETEAA